MIVEGWIADDPTDDQADTYECCDLTACMCERWVNPKIRKVLDADRKK